VVHAVEVAVDRVAILDQAIGDPLPDQRRLAGAGRADHRDRARLRPAEQVRQPLAVRRARHAERLGAGADPLGLVDAERAQHRFGVPAGGDSAGICLGPTRALPSMLGRHP